MPGTQHRATALIAAGIVLVAVLGYAIGHSSAPRKSTPEKILTASANGVLLNYPASWQSMSTAPAIPGLTINQPLALAPAGNASGAALVAGELTGTGPAPLPQTFVALMRHVGETQVLDLLSTQIYRYTGVQIAGFPDALTVYAVPTANGEVTGLACYASPSHATDMRTCERIVASATLSNQAQSADLSPDPTYAHQLSGAIALLNRQRLPVRAQLASAATAAAVRQAAAGLSAAFAAADASLAALEAPPVAVRAQTSLVAATGNARDAYAALASAAASEEQEAMTAARGRVYAAESELERALRNFTLLGYSQS